MLSAVVLASIVTLAIAMDTTDSLVADDYTRHGKAINQRLEKDQAAQRLGVTVFTTVTAQGDGLVRIEATLAMTDSLALRPEALKLRLAHPTLNHLDTQMTLARLPSGSYFALVPPLRGGLWHAAYESDDGAWRFRTRLNFALHQDTQP